MDQSGEDGAQPPLQLPVQPPVQPPLEPPLKAPEPPELPAPVPPPRRPEPPPPRPQYQQQYQQQQQRPPPGFPQQPQSYPGQQFAPQQFAPPPPRPAPPPAAGGGYASGSDGEDRLGGADWAASFPRMSANDERLASSEGHFTRRLQEGGLLDEQGCVTPLGLRRVESMQAVYIHLIINKMLSMNRRYQTVLSVIRDVGEHMGPVNVATAMHRLGKLVRGAKAWNDTLPERTLARPQYRFLLRRAEALADQILPRAMANFLWGMAALGDTSNTAVVRRLAGRLMDVDPRELKAQELSNVVWSLVKLNAGMPELMDRMLDSVGVVLAAWAVGGCGLGGGG